MNNAAVAALLAVLVFVVLASVCAFPFFNCAKKEKFSMQETKSYADRKCPQKVGVSIMRKNSSPVNHCCEWSRDYQLPSTFTHVYFKSAQNFEAGVGYKVNFKDKNGDKITEIVSIDGEVIPPPNLIQNARSYWLTRVYPPTPHCQYGTYTFTKTPSSGKPPVTGCLPRPGEKMQLSDREVASMKFAARTPRNRILLLDSNGKVKTSVPVNKTLDLAELQRLNPSSLVLE